MEGKLTRKSAKLAHFHATRMHVESVKHSYILAVKTSMWAKLSKGPLISMLLMNFSSYHKYNFNEKKKITVLICLKKECVRIRLKEFAHFGITGYYKVVPCVLQIELN